ncbi:PorV/PorQ family protein [candidate division KSB1 bacterium]|nr:PorV/PorQ family protein [candidate division KSB1 bacterium]
MKCKLYILMSGFLLTLNASVSYANFSKVGTSAAQFLKIGVGARAMGMGESFVALANDATTMYWNPAGMINVDQITLALNHSNWFADISHDYAGFILPFSENGRLGFSAIALNTSEQEVTTVENPDGAGLYYDVSDLAVGMSYARALTDRFAFGMTVKYIQQNAYNESAKTVAMDVGTYLKTGFHGLAIAMCMSNYGGTLQLDGLDLITITDGNDAIDGNYRTDARLKTEPYPLPLNFRVGIAMDIIGGYAEHPLIASEMNRLTFALDGSHPNDNLERINMGLEYGWKETLFLRGGYKINYDVEKWAFGGGLQFPVGKQTFRVDYALVDFADLGKVSRLSLELIF